MAVRNHTFDVRYTESGRLVPVTEPLMLRISEQLDMDQRTVSDLQAAISAAPSTLYMTMNKMAASGLIVKCPNEGRRNARFMSSSMSIMRSCDAMDMPSFDWMIRNSHRESDSFLAMLNMFHRMGLDLNPIMRSFGRRLALTPSSQAMYDKMTAEELVKFFGNYLEDNNLGKVELMSFAPFVVRITPSSLMAETYRPVAYIIVGFLKQMFMGITKRDILVSEIDQDGSGGDCWNVRFEFGNGSSRSLDVFKVEPETDTERFVLLKPKEKGMVRLITNPAEVRIMLAVNGHPVRMGDMAKLVGITKSTASMYINNMIRDGFLRSENRSGTVFISSSYSIILYRNSSVSGRVEDLMDMMGRVTDFNSMVHNMMRFFSGTLKFLGFDTHYIMEELGSVVAEQRYASNSEYNVIDLLNRYLTRLRDKNADLEITSVTPLSIRYKVSSRSTIRENMVFYHNGFLKRMLELVEDACISSDFDVFDNGDVRTISYTFAAEPHMPGGR